jgi:hypothetical protein
LLAGAIVAIVAVAVVTDLPTPASRSSQVGSADAFIKEVNTDLAPCDYALAEAYGFRAGQLDGTLTPSDIAQLPMLFRDDEMACSYAGPTISDLTSIESPGTVANTPLGAMLATCTQWATYDALSAIDLIQELSEHPGSAHDATALATATQRLATDRGLAPRVAQVPASATVGAGRTPRAARQGRSRAGSQASGTGSRTRSSQRAFGSFQLTARRTVSRRTSRRAR